MAVNISEYKKSEQNLMNALDKVLGSVSNKISSLSIKKIEFGDSVTSLTLSNNTTYVYNGSDGVKNLTIAYPNGDFITSILFSTAKSGTISISFPKGTKFVGSAPYEFFPGENWELNIHNGIVVGSVIT